MPVIALKDDGIAVIDGNCLQGQNCIGLHRNFAIAAFGIDLIELFCIEERGVVVVACQAFNTFIDAVQAACSVDAGSENVAQVIGANAVGILTCYGKQGAHARLHFAGANAV